MPASLNRRAILSLPALSLGLAPFEAAAEFSAWGHFKQRFVTPSGRIVDNGNGGISHSEGQAWGMLLATIHDDRAAFERIFRWTRSTLAIRGDRLLAWRFRPIGGVDDINSATDADIFHAWALLRAEERWPGQGYRPLAIAIAQDILRVSCRQIGGRVVLMPGAWGFDHGTHLVLNPSYYVFPALEALAAAHPHPAWPALIAEGDRMLMESRHGRWSLPADWVVMRRPGAPVEPEPVRGDRFGDDAVRLPIYLAWSGRWQTPLMQRVAGFWADPRHPYQPAWVTLSDNRIAPFAASRGHAAIRRLVQPTAPEGLADAVTDLGYYSSSLALLAEAAAAEAPMRGSARVASLAR
ncbi:glycosyl hydrolase family 5 [Roseococcus sp. SDR]|uniref:glycosyl hydrolase family 8 n=1 Tax=Roseococcus sp. SDR TaxID=2835532 RepID=UPI001BCDD0E9|nr:glycosyl hydrolase family 8 [Roseococcus sp. SDR]MBS7789457.1 glycosyl hydrolase family 5 [Roseococcus sp. SDR]MBV1844771.1 glycosyl hydrolase family 5 [Roseococcus sp. SDR]